MAAREHASGAALAHSGNVCGAGGHVAGWPVRHTHRVPVSGVGEPVLHGAHLDWHGGISPGVYFDLEILVGKWWARFEAEVRPR